MAFHFSFSFSRCSPSLSAFANASWYEVIEVASGFVGFNGFRNSDIGGTGETGVKGGVMLNWWARKRGRGKTSASHQVSATILMDFLALSFAKDDTFLRFGVEEEDFKACVAVEGKGGGRLYGPVTTGADIGVVGC